MTKPNNATEKVRAVADGVSGIGVHRYELYLAAWRHVQQSTAAGYHLEAITLLESLITDRMESRASFLTGKNEGFSTLGKLITIFHKHEQVPEFRALVDRIDQWRELRNKALHEMVKFSQGDFPTWAEQTGGLSDVVRDGQICLHAFAALDEKERARNGSSPPATWPNAFGLVPPDGVLPANSGLPTYSMQPLPPNHRCS